MYTEQQLAEYYERFNALYFGRSLPRSVKIRYLDKLPIDQPRAVACAELHWYEGSKPDAHAIYFLRRFFAGKHPHLILSSLLHEMIHIYLGGKGPTLATGHGPLFRSLCKRLRQLGWSVDVTCNPAARPFEVGSHKVMDRSALTSFRRHPNTHNQLSSGEAGYARQD